MHRGEADDRLPTATTVLVPAGGIAPSVTGSLPLRSRTSTSASQRDGHTRMWVKTACDTIIGPRTIVADGTMTQPRMPYGTGFVVCAVDGTKKASARSTTELQRAERDDHEHADPAALSGGSCPFTTT